jgi:hypothetical protein
MKVVDRDNISTEIIVPSKIRHKCLIINRGQDESDIYIPCNIRFEKDVHAMCLHDEESLYCRAIKIQISDV